MLDLDRADYTFLNERLAAHYGIDGVFGNAFRRVALQDPNRRGLLGQGSILFQTSVANRTSPVFRGKWIMTNFFNSPPPPPPANVPALEESIKSSAPHSVRERLEQHRKDPVCAGCHAIIDPPGLALENFDPIGRWRDTDSGQAVDAKTTLPGGIPISGPSGLREAILSRPELFVSTFTEKLMVYALGRRLDAEDMPTVRRIVREAARDDYRFSAIVRGIVRSPQFQQKARFPASAPQTVADTRASSASTESRSNVHHEETSFAPHRVARRARRRDRLAAARRDGAGRERRAAVAAPVRRGLRAERNSAGDLYAAVGGQARAAAAARAVRAVARAHQYRHGAPSPDPFGHHVIGSLWLSGGSARPTQGADVQAGQTIDQHIADEIGRDTPLRSLELGIEDINSSSNSCQFGWSCLYLNTLSWQTPTMPLPNEQNPQNAFERMFGDIGSAEERAARFKSKASILDSVISAASRLNNQLAPQDRSTVEEYLANIREVESRIQSSGQRADYAGETPDAPAGIPGSYDEHVRVMYDLIALAWRADITRVTTFMKGVEASSIGYPQIGVPESHHIVSHHGNVAATIAKYAKINAYHLSLFAEFVEKLRATPDGDGSLLDIRWSCTARAWATATSTIRRWSRSCSRDRRRAASRAAGTSRHPIWRPWRTSSPGSEKSRGSSSARSRTPPDVVEL